MIKAENHRTDNSEIEKKISKINFSKNLTCNQKKLFNTLLYQAQGTLHISKAHEINVQHLCGVLGYNCNEIEKLKNDLYELTTTSISWTTLNKVSRRNRWSTSSLLCYTELKDVICTYEYSPSIRELLDYLCNYEEINLLIENQDCKKFIDD